MVSTFPAELFVLLMAPTYPHKGLNKLFSNFRKRIYITDENSFQIF